VKPDFRSDVTPTGLVLTTFAVLALVLGSASRQLFPESAIGHLLGSSVGVVTAIVGWWLLFTVVSVVLTLSGYPPFTRNGKEAEPRC
jgi:hypothetical protein